jgi:molybdopterin/thiamine biosynthesis adenylyltransferase
VNDTSAWINILIPPTELQNKSALIVGMGGLGCPAALALVRAGVGHLVLCDNDKVDETNLHRQILFGEQDLGRDKLDAAKEALEREGATEVTLIRSRLLPDVARQMVRNVDVVLEGADNFPTKFLASDACFLEKKPVIHGAAVRFVGTAFSVPAGGRPCYRCLFEDLLNDGDAPNCTEAGVVGPAVGIVGALMADLALDVLVGDGSRQGTVYSFDGKSLSLRPVSLSARRDCQLCGSDAEDPISELHKSRYVRPPLQSASPVL